MGYLDLPIMLERLGVVVLSSARNSDSSSQALPLTAKDAGFMQISEPGHGPGVSALNLPPQPF